MNEFNNRISAQRDVLTLVNSIQHYREPLFGLTEKAINRWVTHNAINVSDPIVTILKSLSENLFFLANRSQEQITEDYKVLSIRISDLISTLRQELAS
ncbi:MAG: hypothetical protein OEY38_12755 [Gammaproteobacteria bacterium]|nr:hypothetical protein [Gammaproteobacteria bacterium]